MPKRLIQFRKNEHYHLMNRGILKKTIFFSKKDYTYFLETMDRYKHKFSVDVVFYCLMPNHFHLIIKQNEESGTLEFISRLQLVYSKYFNKNYGRKGQVFEGRYLIKFIDTSQYLIRLIKYLINNPVEAGLVKRTEDWKWMSFFSSRD